ncbi:MAG: hypothetical protein Q4D33_09275, partial [Prevotellaceae bacterium]|nr:hypothetical protein [Prevotellaceae bacterium]
MKHFNSILASVLMLMGLLSAGNASAQEWHGAAIANNMASSSKPVYLYNVGAEAFFVNGGSWGTAASLNTGYGLPLISVEATDSNWYVESDLNTTEGTYLCMITEGDANAFFCDRKKSTKVTEAITKLTFEAVPGSTNNEYYINAVHNGNHYMTAESIVGNSKKGTVKTTTNTEGDYSKWILVTTDEVFNHLKTHPADLNNPVNVTFLIKDPNLDRGNIEQSNWQMVEWNQWQETIRTTNSPSAGRTYLIGYPDGDEYFFMTMDSNGNLGRSRNAKDAAVWTVGGSTNNWTFNCNGKYLSRSNLTASTSSTAQGWRVAANGITINGGWSTFGRLEYFGGTWIINIDIWSTNNARVITESMSTKANAGLKLGVQDYYKTAPDNRGESSCSGDDGNDYREAWGQFFGAESRGNYGKFQQQIKVYHTGWYTLSCQGFFWNSDKMSDDVVSLFAEVDGEVSPQYLSQANVDGAVPADWHAAAKELFPGTRYNNAVMFYVEVPGADAYGYNPAGKTITIGIQWDEEKSNMYDWTVFDDFQLQFMGRNTNLILEE